MSRLADAQAGLVFSTEVETVKANLAVLGSAIAEVQAELAALKALKRAVQGMCPHNNKQHHYDGWKCWDCEYMV